MVGQVGSIMLIGALGFGVTGCGSESIAEDAAIACGWNEPDEPIVLPAEASKDQLRTNVERAQRRLAAAERVVAGDDRFTALEEALAETASFAVRLRDMPAEEIEQIGNEEWDFAKYVQFVARDQCEQLRAVVGDE